MKTAVRTEKSRKDFALHIANVTSEKVRYSGVPKCEYTIGLFTVKKDGSLECPDDADQDLKNKVLESLTPSNGFEILTDNETVSGEKPETASIMRKVSEFSEAGLKNLYDIISAKKSLLQKALGKESVDLRIDTGYIYFPWTDKEPGFDEYTAVLHLVDAICKLAKSSQRNSSREKKTSNEKYAFRCFLLRLGFIGDKYKTSRKILMRNLEGSSAFRKPKARNQRKSKSGNTDL